MKDLGFIELYEVYKELFTANQRRLLDGYYDYDLTLSELAERLNVSKSCLNHRLRRLVAIADEL